MEYVELGSTGLSVSPLCLGTAAFGREVSMHDRERLASPIVDRAESHALLDAAASRGINFVDTADTYGRPEEGRTERYIGSWLGTRDREEFVVASKVGLSFRDGPNGGGLSRKRIRSAISGTLARLGTDYLDLYYIHRWDQSTPIRETLSALNELVRDGLVHYLGASNVAAWQLVKALGYSEHNGLERFEVLQTGFNAASRDRAAALLDVCADRSLTVCPYSPLEGGFLAGKYERGAAPPENSRAERDSTYGTFSDRQWRVLDAVEDVADETGMTPAQVSLRWLLDQNRVAAVPVIGPRSTDQLADSVAALDGSLTAAQVSRITDAYGTD